MLDESHRTAAVLKLLQSLAGPRVERRRQEDRLAAEGAAAASAAAAAELATDTAAAELPWLAEGGGSGGGVALSEGRMQRIRAVAVRRQRGLIVVLEGLVRSIAGGDAINLAKMTAMTARLLCKSLRNGS